MLLGTYAPLKRINKYKLKLKSKPWINLGLQKSISVKNKLLTNFINKKDHILKEEFHTKYKKYRHLLSTLMKKSKQAYYDKYFERNWNIKNTWKGIKSLISLKTVASHVPTVLSLDNGDTITNPYDIANTFNNYFASIAETMKKSIKYSHKHLHKHNLSNETSSTIFLQPTDKEEIGNIISPLNSNKASCPNSISYRILFLLKNEILKQLTDLFNLSLTTGVFPSVLKIAKVVPAFKKDSKLDYSNYCPISMLSGISGN